MWFRSVLASLKSRPSVPPVRRSPQRPPAPRLCLEALEDRNLPSFLGPVNYPAGQSPQVVLTGDFNGDHRLDLATTDFGGFSVLPGNGDGTFQAARTAGPGFDEPVADFNGDGKPDLLIAEPGGTDDFGNTIGGGVGLAPGNGDGTFQAPISTGTGGSPYAVAIGDMNGDGKLDLAVLSSGSSYYVDPDSPYYPNGGTVSTYSSLSTLLGRGDGSFSSGVTRYASAPYFFTTVDLNRDGPLDLVTRAGGAGGGVSVQLGNSTGGFGVAQNFTVGSDPVSVVAGDFNGDGFPDLATANYGSADVSVLLNAADWPVRLPAVAVGDVTITEGNTGTRAATFTVSLSAAFDQPVTVGYATADGTATAGSDYQPTSGTLTFALGETSKTVTAQVIGDRLPEANETFFVNLSAPTNATIADGQGQGTIVDDEPRISISDVTKAEGKKNQTTQFTFTVTLSAAYDQAVTMSYRTADGTATASDGDYVGKTGTLTFAPGETTKTITIVVNGDGKKEADETFYLDLFGNSSNSLFTKKRGIGTILNDD